MRRARVKSVIRLMRAFTPPVQAVEALPEVPTDAMPFLTVWVAYDRLLGSCFNIMRECKPVVAALNKLINGRYEE
jgi:hypothetical protein